VAQVAVPVVLVGGVATYWLSVVRNAAYHERAVLKEHARATRAHYAAVEAAEDDPDFSPDVIEHSVDEVVSLADGLWQGGFRDLGDRLDAGLVKAWARSWQSCLGSELEAVGKPSVDLLSVVKREDEEEDRVVARVRVRIRCQNPKGGTLGVHHTHSDERWTFGRSEGAWVLVSVSGDPLAGPILNAPLIPTRSSDSGRLLEESLAELASTQKVGEDVDLNDLVSADAPPAFALLDLSVIDNRFLPALMAAELAHLLEAWEEATTGSEAPLEELAGVDARAALLRPAPGARLFVRDVVLKSWEPTTLELSRHPPAVEVSLDVEAVRFVVRDDGSPMAGNQRGAHRMALKWLLELTDSKSAPWRLATSNSPAEAIPGWS
jgi:hypothetical protein